MGAADKELLEKLKSHIQLEEGMDDSLLSFYLDSAKRYVKLTTGSNEEYLIVMVSALMYEYRVSEEDLQKALKAIEPMLILEVLAGGEKIS
ncbi:head-tail connector protein [Vagococcus salmoninarum]|uniref:head-tail connector protein n=1 Tax=Vagococcus salmoninarum TaxID=2739 RepID=UPI001D14071E|nr:head-tail connector protein [Vagococcus salmoninarum]